ncbi:cytochrome C oxidase Cbb3 [Maricaulis sp. W15]|uniref:Cbb3-type cytochrome oxidase maturation protein n=1 Tax=Maricaulis maris TaxID=74318 RepID=A0A495D252_9PROT|nr:MULTISPECIES: cbb3-type cytochrome oxidase assembly protein CcoS [Maricaulis]OLF77732.1 cytochrome C oxidase Cbb3 [Maricaulis sp. W15]RKQ95608.1 cbb3-type cytochrome oxidase maturation protein [Maricaulis maris]
MSVLIWLIPVALAMGALGLVGFLWSLRSGQYEDMDGAAQRILMDDDTPLSSPGETRRDDNTRDGDD